MRAETLERRLDKLRAQYWEGLERRISNYDTMGYTKDKRFTKWEGRLQRKLAMIRTELAQLKPEKYHFGKMNKGTTPNTQIHSKHGDNGLMLCEECRGLFEWTYKKKMFRFVENFRYCGEHKGMKCIAKITIKDGVFQ